MNITLSSLRDSRRYLQIFSSKGHWHVLILKEELSVLTFPLKTLQKLLKIINNTWGEIVMAELARRPANYRDGERFLRLCCNSGGRINVFRGFPPPLIRGLGNDLGMVIKGV